MFIGEFAVCVVRTNFSGETVNIFNDHFQSEPL